VSDKSWKGILKGYSIIELFPKHLLVVTLRAKLESYMDIVAMPTLFHRVGQ